MTDFRARAVLVGAAASLIFTAVPAMAQMAPSAAKPQVSVITLHPRSVAITAELPGRTAASLVAEVRPQVNGIIRERLFTEGSEVEAGKPLYQIDKASYSATYDSALAALQRAEAAVPSAQARVERYEGLIKQNAVAKQDYDDAVASLASAKASVAAAKADVETARINLDYTTIRAPITGRVDQSSLTVGALVTANQATALTTIRALEPINVDIIQSSTNLLNLRRAVDEGKVKLSGDNVTVRLKLDNDMLYSHGGKLEFAESNIQPTTGTYALRAEFPNPERLLLPGMYVRAIVEEGVAENSFLVPQRAVTRNTKGEPVAYFVNADNKIELRVLTLQNSVGNNWLVREGVSDNDRILVEGSQFVRPGMEVNAVEVVIDDTTGEVSEVKNSMAGSTLKTASNDGVSSARDAQAGN